MKDPRIEHPEYDLFTYSVFYNYLVDKFKDDDVFVEIGSWIGTSISYMADRVKKRNLKVKLYTIDLFDANKIKGDEYIENLLIYKENKIYETFLECTENVKDYINVIKGDSKEVYKQFKDQSITHIFFDGDHTLEGFEKDIKLWYPKVKYGGIFSGHDYIWGGHGVKPVIDTFSGFKAKNFGIGDVWYYAK